MSRSDKKGNQSPQVTERARTPAGDSAKQKIPEAEASGNLLEVTTRFELVDEGFADPCLTTWPRHHIGSDEYHSNGAADEARTRYLHLGKVALYQMSYGRIFGAFVPAPSRAILANVGAPRKLAKQDFVGKRRNFRVCYGGLTCKTARQTTDIPTSDPDRARTDDPQRDRLVL